MTVHSFEQAVQLLHDRINLEHLQAFPPQAMKGRLDILQQILDSLGNPETAYRTVHITGTKGKGSTCIILESLLLQAGWRVGRFTSPHLNSFLERLAIDGAACPPDEFAELFFSVYNQIEPDIFQSLTYFELLTLLSFVYFAQKEIDVALFEVGLGGRLDATNLCRPDVSIITSISYDHLQQLGPALTDIAAEKSGIIKPDVPVVTTVLHPEPQNVIRNKANVLGTPFFVLNDHFFIRRSSRLDASHDTFCYETSTQNFPVEFSLDDVTLTLRGSHQIRNASAALSAFLLLHQGEKTFDKEKIRTGLEQAFLPLRGEIIRPADNSPILIFDGAHNRSSIRAFIKMVFETFPKQRLFLIFGVSQGKDVEGMFAEIIGHFHHIFLTQSSNSRRFPPQGLRSIFATYPDGFSNETQQDDEDFLDPSVSLQPNATDKAGYSANVDRELKNTTVVNDCREAMQQCLCTADSNDVVCITGSLYLSAELRKYVLESK